MSFLKFIVLLYKANDFPAHFQSVDEEDFYFYSGFHHQTEKQHIQFDMQKLFSQISNYSSPFQNAG